MALALYYYKLLALSGSCLLLLALLLVHAKQCTKHICIVD